MNNQEKIGRNDPCFCGSGKKYKRCCLPKLEFALAQSRKMSEAEFQEWFKKDVQTGMDNLKAMGETPPVDDSTPTPAFAQGSEGEKLFNEMMKE